MVREYRSSKEWAGPQPVLLHCDERTTNFVRFPISIVDEGHQPERKLSSY